MATKVKRARAKKTASKKASATRPGARRQPETLRLRKIAPSFTATDLQRSIAFYRDVLGLVIGEEWRLEGVHGRCWNSSGSMSSLLGNAVKHRQSAHLHGVAPLNGFQRAHDT